VNLKKKRNNLTDKKMTKETQDKLFSLYINKDEVRKEMRTPWYDKRTDSIMASDGRQLIAIRKSATIGDFPTSDINPFPLIGKTLGLISVSELKDALLKLSTWDETLTHEEEMDCEECGGKGFVEYIYTSKDGEEYCVEDACPICNGSGKTIRHKYIKTGRKIPAKDATITIGTYNISWRYMENVCKVCDLVSSDMVLCTEISQDCVMLSINGDIAVLIMRHLREGENNATIEYNEQEN
jgi:hypothetical protein